MATKIIKSYIHYNERLDKLIFNHLKKYSRSLIKKWILNNQVLVNNKIINKPSKKFLGYKKIFINNIIEEKNDIFKPQNIKLKIIYEDKDILVIDKKNNMVVHPGVGNTENTLLNALIYHYPDNIFLPRAGIVHRLDKNTTGLMVVAKNMHSYFFLIKAIKKHKIIRIYEAIVEGEIKKNGIVNQPIMRHINKRTCMMVHSKGKHAITYYKIIKKFNNFTYISLKLKTGRTHQIRVHMSYIKHKIVGDKKYGNKNIQNIFFNKLNRQALHAVMLSFVHPSTNNIVKFYSPIPKDMLNLLSFIKKNFSFKTNNFN